MGSAPVTIRIPAGNEPTYVAFAHAGTASVKLVITNEGSDVATFNHGGHLAVGNSIVIVVAGEHLTCQSDKGTALTVQAV